MNTELNSNFFLNKELRNDQVFVPNSLEDFPALVGMPTRKGLEMAVISNGKLVNTVSDDYGHLPNENFFGKMEESLKAAGIGYATKSINRNDCSFAVDYILRDESFHVNVKGTKDKIVPMLRLTNSYDGKCKTGGHFGFYREICSNGLHVAGKSNIGFSLKKRGYINEIIVPKIDELIAKFMDNEFYSLHKKFEVLQETLIEDVDEFVEYILGETGLFKYEKSEKNPDQPSKKAAAIIDTINRESEILGTPANLWLGYNAMNEMLHDKTKKRFDIQESQDEMIFNTILEMVN